jgi:hypothetical protein
MPVAGEKADEQTLIFMVDMVVAAEFLIGGDTAQHLQTVEACRR